ncbi:hypothetical protein F4805DRAFT_423769 [Annulohypoxylon moriforme]|nr:hypothetical protein F4805DRAFT_423769 [Annulohypoxylon moriforme]
MKSNIADQHLGTLYRNLAAVQKGLVFAVHASSCPRPATATTSSNLTPKPFANITETAQTTRDRPHLLNQLPYTTNIIKESRRLFPLASTIHSNQPDIS